MSVRMSRRLDPGMAVGGDLQDPQEIERKRHKAQGVTVGLLSGMGLLGKELYEAREAELASPDFKAKVDAAMAAASKPYDSTIAKFEGQIQKVRQTWDPRFKGVKDKMRRLPKDDPSYQSMAGALKTMIEKQREDMAGPVDAVKLFKRKQRNSAEAAAMGETPGFGSFLTTENVGKAVGTAALAAGLYYGGRRLMSGRRSSDEEKQAMIKGFYKTAVAGGPVDDRPSMSTSMAQGMADALVGTPDRDQGGFEGGKFKQEFAVNTGVTDCQPGSQSAVTALTTSPRPEPKRMLGHTPGTNRE